MTHKQRELFKYGLFALFIIILFVINSFFENKYLLAEKNVQIFKKEHSTEYDSLLREYDIQFEIIEFKNDSSENVIEQKYTILRHELEMQRLKNKISDDYYYKRYDEILELEINEISKVNDSLFESFTRLDYPEKIEIPRYLLKKAKLFGGLDAITRFTKWLLFVILIIFMFWRYFNIKTVSVNPNQNISPQATPLNLDAEQTLQAQTEEVKKNTFEYNGGLWQRVGETKDGVSIQEVKEDENGNLIPSSDSFDLIDTEEFNNIIASQV